MDVIVILDNLDSNKFFFFWGGGGGGSIFSGDFSWDGSGILPEIVLNLL